MTFPPTRLSFMRTDFDAYANGYDETMKDSISFGGQEHAFFVEFKAKHLLHLMRTRVGEPSSLRILDVGCGVGLTDVYLLSEVQKLHGVDTAAAAVARAARTTPTRTIARTRAIRSPTTTAPWT